PPEAPVPAGTHPRAASTRSGAGAPPQFAAPTDRRSFLPFSTQPPPRTLILHNSRKKSTLLGSVLIWWRRCCGTAVRRGSGAPTLSRLGHYPIVRFLAHERNTDRARALPIPAAVLAAGGSGGAVVVQSAVHRGLCPHHDQRRASLRQPGGYFETFVARDAGVVGHDTGHRDGGGRSIRRRGGWHCGFGGRETDRSTADGAADGSGGDGGDSL